MKKILSVFLSLTMIITLTSCSANNTSSDNKADTSSGADIVSGTSEGSDASTDTPSDAPSEDDPAYRYVKYASMTPEEIVAELTLEQKAAQMVQPAIYELYGSNPNGMKNNGYGSILSNMVGYGYKDWQNAIRDFQTDAVNSPSGIPFLYGQDDVHGVNYCANAVIFPHNIGLGAANDEELMYQVGLITADEAKLCNMLWNFAPVVSHSLDPRWGRTYECYSSDLETVTRLSTAYTRGLIDGGIAACAKHFFAEGYVQYGSGEGAYLIDRGNAVADDAQIEELLKVWQAMIDAGVQTIMISHASLNGIKMHENGKYIMMLKEEMGFEGFIVSDWESIHNIPDKSFKEQVVASVNAGIDMLMEPSQYDNARKIIVSSVKSGDISEERVNDAVRRIIKVKKELGLFDDPFCEKLETKQSVVGTKEYRDVAETLVEKSLVLLKNDNNVLPLKQGASVYITGPAAVNAQAQCGGWTVDWNQSPFQSVPGATTILDGFMTVADDYGITVITDPKEASSADVVINIVGEKSYAEWFGDTEDMELCGALGLDGNRKAIDEVRALGKPTVTCIVAGRQVILDQADFDSWDSVVMCYLPGSEGQGVANVLCGGADFTGRLPSPWYSSVDQIGTDDCMFERGYGLSYN